jgi:hypothetical protein
MDVNPKQRRRHGAAFKAQVLAACAELGAVGHLLRANAAAPLPKCLSAFRPSAVTMWMLTGPLEPATGKFR